MIRSELVPVSAITLAHQSNRLLKQAIDSVQFCQEIIIIDNGAKLEKSFFEISSKLRVINLSNQPLDDFSHVRNWVMQQARFDWILFIDSDERFANPKLAKNNIAQAIQTNQPAFDLIRSDIFQGFKLNHGEAGYQLKTRLIRRDQTKFHRPVHETVKIKSKQNTTQLPITLLHQAHQNISQFLKKVNHYAQIEAQYRYQHKNSNSFSILFQLLCYPSGKFVYNYLFKLGFLDQMPGLIYASLMSLHSALVRVYWWQLIHNQKDTL